MPTPTHTHWSILPSENAKETTQHFPSMDRVFALDAEIISKSIQSDIFAYVINDKTYYIKRYSRSVGLASWLGFSRLHIETRNQLWFNHANLPSAKVVAYGEERFFLKTLRGVLVTEAIDDTVDLDFIANKQPEKFQNALWCHTLITQLASILRFFHANRFCHNDLHWRNILIKETPLDDNIVQAYLIDCPSGRRIPWPFLAYKKLKDLANIDKHAPHHFSRTQRLRFFFTYRNITKLEHDDKVMIRKILQHKANRIKRKARQNKNK